MGNVTKLTSSTGAIDEQYYYDVYGNVTIKNPIGAVLAASGYSNRFLFTGAEYVTSLGLYDLRNRFYSAPLGRFLQPDPITFLGDNYNIYRYCHNSPANFLDLYGESTSGSLGNTALGAAAGAGTGAVTGYCFGGAIGAVAGVAVGFVTSGGTLSLPLAIAGWEAGSSAGAAAGAFSGAFSGGLSGYLSGGASGSFNPVGALDAGAQSGFDDGVAAGIGAGLGQALGLGINAFTGGAGSIGPDILGFLDPVSDALSAVGLPIESALLSIDAALIEADWEAAEELTNPSTDQATPPPSQGQGTNTDNPPQASLYPYGGDPTEQIGDEQDGDDEFNGTLEVVEGGSSDITDPDALGGTDGSAKWHQGLLH